MSGTPGPKVGARGHRAGDRVLSGSSGAVGSQPVCGGPQASLPLTISWCTPPPARGNRPQTGTWRPACPRAAGASTPRSWPPPPPAPAPQTRGSRWPTTAGRAWVPMAPRAAIRAARPVRGRCPRLGPGADHPAAAAGARRVVGLSRPGRRGASGRGSAERRARRFLEPHPRRKAGGAPAGGGGRGRGGSGGRGGLASGASRGGRCRGGSGGGGAWGRTKGPARTARPADSARRRCGRVGRGESYQQFGAALRSTAQAATLPARSPGRYVLIDDGPISQVGETAPERTDMLRATLRI